ncbi:MAG: TIR domain-containing protein [Sphingomicrobium sp.]
MSGPDIFISYSREDRTTARHFSECFAKEGFKVWWDAALHSGETFDEVIETELKAARAVVVLWSPRSVRSRWVRAEATLADRRKKLAPVIIEPCDRPIIFELTHTTDLSQWSGDLADPAWRGFVQDLHRFVDRSKAAAQSENEPAVAAAPKPADIKFAPDQRYATIQRFADGKVDNLMVALTTLQNAISGSQAASPMPVIIADDDDDDDDESEATQFYTNSNGYENPEDELHCLEMMVDGRLEKRFVVGKLGLKIGRSAPAEVVIADARVSRTHCLVEQVDDKLRVTDLGSTNGSFVDSQRISAPTVLDVGSILRVGNALMTHTLRTRAEL